MEAIQAFFNTIVSVLGNIVMVPLMILIVGLIIRMKFPNALRSALTIGVGFIGVYTILTLFLGQLGPVAEAIAQRAGGEIKLDMIDVGWPAAYSAAFAFPVLFSYVIAAILFNLLLVLLNRVKTLQISLAEIIIGQALIGMAAYKVSNNYIIGLVVCLLISTINLILADWQAPIGEKYFGFKGVSLIQVGVNEWGLIAWPIIKVLDKIAFLKQGRFTPEYVAKKFGILGEPIFIGVIFGVLLGLFGGYSFTSIVLLAMNLAAALFLMPRMVNIIMEGFLPLQDSSRDFLQQHASGREIYLGLDPALGTGHTSILATVMIMIPITLLIAIVLPGNRVLPIGDLSTLVFTLMFIVVMNRGDLLRSVITSTLVMPLILWGGTLAGPYMNELFVGAGVVEAGSSTLSLSMFCGGQLYWYPLMKAAEFAASSNIAMIATIIIAIAIGVALLLLVHRKQSKEQILENGTVFKD